MVCIGQEAGRAPVVGEAESNTTSASIKPCTRVPPTCARARSWPRTSAGTLGAADCTHSWQSRAMQSQHAGRAGKVTFHPLPPKLKLRVAPTAGQQKRCKTSTPAGRTRSHAMPCHRIWGACNQPHAAEPAVSARCRVIHNSFEVLSSNHFPCQTLPTICVSVSPHPCQFQHTRTCLENPRARPYNHVPQACTHTFLGTIHTPATSVLCCLRCLALASNMLYPFTPLAGTTLSPIHPNRTDHLTHVHTTKRHIADPRADSRACKQPMQQPFLANPTSDDTQTSLQSKGATENGSNHLLVLLTHVRAA